MSSGSTIIAGVIGLVQLLFARRFLLVTFDPEAARVAGVNTRLWSLALNLAIGVAAAAAVHAIGALSTFALLTLPAMAALLATASVRATFITAAALSIVLPSLALALSFYLDLPAGPASVALLAVSVPLAAMSRIRCRALEHVGTACRHSRPAVATEPERRLRVILSGGDPMAPLLTRTLVACLMLILLASGSVAQPQAEDAQAIRAELNRLRQEFDATRQQYGDKLSTLEARLAELEGGTSPGVTPETPQTPTPATEPAAPVPPGAAGGDAPKGTLPVYGNASVLSKIFNPDLAVMGNFLGAAGRNPAEPHRPWRCARLRRRSRPSSIPMPGRTSSSRWVPRELRWKRAYVTFPTLPGGFLMKAGKLRSAFGKVNAMHSHVLPWTDRPLVSQNLLGGEEGIADAGVSVARLLPNPWIFLEATGEVYRGESAVFHIYERQDLTYVGHMRGFRDITESSNVDFGASFAHGHNDAGPSATTRIVGLDGTFRYRPLRRAMYRRLLARGEVVWSRRSEANGPDAFGAYLAGDYQFARRWFAGVRFDRAGRATDPNANDTGTSWLVTYWPSEFSQIRGQYRRTNYAEGQTANEVLFQFLFSIGAHGAHAF